MLTRALMFACSGTRLRGGGGGGGGGGDEGSGPFALWAKYLDLLDAKPLATRMVTGFAIGTFGDILSQYTAGGKHLLCLLCVCRCRAAVRLPASILTLARCSQIFAA